MRQFNYTLKEPIGIHARPAGLLAKAVKALDSTVTIEKAGSEPVLAVHIKNSAFRLWPDFRFH